METQVLCQNCGTKCKTIIKIGKQPICNRNLKTREEFKTEKKYPLGMYFCPKCKLVQQPEQHPTSLLFPVDFNYLSSSSKAVVEFYEGLAQRYITDYSLQKDDVVIEIASNDGVFLKNLVEARIRVVGIDPATIPAKMANDKGIYTLNKDFVDVEEEICLLVNGRAKLICAFDVLAHTGDIHIFLDKLSDLMLHNPNAVFISQSHYLPKLIEECEFDTAYLEHQRFYTLTSLTNLLGKHHIHIYDAEETNFYGGSFLAYATYESKPTTGRYDELIKRERKYIRYKTYKPFRKQVRTIRKELIGLIDTEKAKGKKIIGIGAPMKSSVLLNYCKIRRKQISYLLETNSLKIGTYHPGTHISIKNEEEFFGSKDNNENTSALILSWNMKDKIMKSWREKGFKGEFIIPLPQPKIME